MAWSYTFLNIISFANVLTIETSCLRYIAGQADLVHFQQLWGLFIISECKDLTTNILFNGIYKYDEQQLAQDWSMWNPIDNLLLLWVTYMWHDPRFST